VLIFLRDADDEPQVRPHELVERFLITLANALRERDLVFPRDERIDADVAQVLIQRALFERRLLVVRSGGHAGGSRAAAAPRPITVEAEWEYRPVGSGEPVLVHALAEPRPS